MSSGSDRPGAIPVAGEPGLGGGARRPTPPGRERNDGGRAVTPLAAAALVIAIAAVLLAGVAVVGEGGTSAGAGAAAPMLGMTDGVMAAASDGGARVEPFRRVDPALPAVPAGKVKKFRVTVYEHVTRVSPERPPARVWSYAVNGVFHRGSGVSQPLVVNQGDTVQITLVNGVEKEMHVDQPHSIDFHSAEVAPNVDYKTIAPGQTFTFRFRAKHPGVFLYHCATEPVLLHTAAGMVGMMIVKPRKLPRVDRELWITQQEYYLGRHAGDDADLAKARAKRPDVIAFNGYADQYRRAPVRVKPHERIRVYVLNAGPSLWSVFHVIGTVFDTTHVEGVTGHDAQSISLAPAQGGWVEFTLDHKGTYTFLDHSLADTEKGAAGVLAAGAPAKPGTGH